MKIFMVLRGGMFYTQGRRLHARAFKPSPAPNPSRFLGDVNFSHKATQPHSCIAIDLVLAAIDYS